MTLPRSRRSPAAGPAARAFLLLLALVATAVPAMAAEGLTISDARMRLVIPSRPAAGYFTLSNGTDRAQALVGASSPACGMIMLHQSLHQNGQERMVMRKRVNVPAHGSVSFAPGGYHLMCMKPSMQVGASVPVVLKFADGKTLSAQFPVKGAGGK